MIGAAARRRSPALPLAALLLALPVPAAAHPHVWIDAVATLVVEHGALGAIAMVWRMDEIFSGFLLDEYDHDHDGRFDAEETKTVEAEAFVALADLGWLTHLRNQDGEIPLDGYRDFALEVDDGKVAYHFTLTLAQPLALDGAKLVIGLYDESYYIDIAVDPKAPLLIRGIPATACRARHFADADHPIYFDTVEPMVTELTCRLS